MSGREECIAVSLSGGGPWGFRLQGGAGTKMPLTVSKVRRKSKAYRRLREGDRILSVNGRPCDALTYEQLMDIADNSHTDLHLQILRRECDKENEAPPPSRKMASEDNPEVSSPKEKEGVIESSKLEEPVEPFPLFSDLSTSTRQEVVSDDEKNFTKTRHEVKGPEVSLVQESRSVDSPHSLPDITLDTIDLNNLISETQKRLDSFRHNFGALDTTPSRREEVVQSSEKQEELRQEEVAIKCEPAKKIPKPKVEAFKECLREMETDSPFSLPDVGIPSQSAETSTIPFGTDTATLIKKKKMFSSSSFYEEPNSIYPTMEEQVEMARKIADSLADDTNKKSKGANMFYKRVKRSTKWIHEGPEPSDESGPGTPEVEPPTPDISQVPFRPSKGPPRLKLVLDPRHPLDLTALRSSGYVISEHNVVSPEVCHGLVKDLQSPVGKGAALFAKRKKKSEEWVVDEEKVKTLLREQKERQFHVPPLSTIPAFNQYSAPLRQDVKLVKSPWEAAMESPFGLCDAAFSRVHPGQLADTVMKRADYIRSESLSRESSRMEGCVSPPQLADVYHAKAPRGWEGNFEPINYSAPQQSPKGVFQPSKKMVFQNFNAVPRLWKGASVH